MCKEANNKIKEKSISKEEIMGVKELAEYLNLSVWTIYKYVSDRKIPYYKLNNGKVFFKVSEINELIFDKKNRVMSIKEEENEINLQASNLLLEDKFKRKGS